MGHPQKLTENAASRSPTTETNKSTESTESTETEQSLPSALEQVRRDLVDADLARMDDTTRLATLRALEDLSRAASAVGVRVMVDFDASQVRSQARRGAPVSRRGEGVADDLAGARKTSPYWGSRHLTSAKALVKEMPHTLAALTDGVIDAYQARAITEATTCLDVEDRAEVDQRLAPRLPGASTREMIAAARALTYEVDPKAFVERARRAAKDRGVSIRPAPDVMGILNARLTAPHAIACYAALKEHAIAARAAGDPRTEQQLMADELFARLTGRTVVDGIDVEIGLVMTDETLFADGHTAADLIGFGPVPADLAKDWLRPEPSGDEGAPDTRPHPDPRPGPDPDPHPGPDPDPRSRRDPGHPSEHSPRRGSADDISQGFCPDGGRCTSASCTLTHAPTAPAPPSSSSPSPSPSPSPSSPSPTPSPTMQPAPSPTSGRTSSPGGADSWATSPADGADSSESSCADGAASSQTADPHPGPSKPHQPQRRPVDQSQETARRAAKVWLRRLYTDPVTGVLSGRDPRRRLFTGSLRQLVISRDRSCRNSWCGAPIRHIDHVQRHSDQGTTTDDNGRGLCARCNLAREKERHPTRPPTEYRPPPPLLDGLPAPVASRERRDGSAVRVPRAGPGRGGEYPDADDVPA